MRASSKARAIALTGYFGLWLLLSLWYSWLAPSTQLPIYIPLGFLLIPLVFPFAGLIQGKPYTYMWSSYLSLLYFAHGIGEAYTLPNERIYGIIEIILSLMFFFGSIYYVRLSKREE